MNNKKFESQWQQLIVAEYHGNPDYLDQLNKLLVACKASSIKRVDDPVDTVFNITIPGWCSAWNKQALPTPTHQDEMGVEYHFPNDVDIGSKITATVDRYGNEWSTIMIVQLL